MIDEANSEVSFISIGRPKNGEKWAKMAKNGQKI
jgi:hypothetical protein